MTNDNGPLIVTADDGAVVIQGLCGEPVTLSAGLAMELSQQLISSAARARGQRRVPALFFSRS